MNANHAFTYKWAGLARALQTPIGVTQSSFPKPRQKVIRANPAFYQAIWDTGATGSVVTEKVARDLKLKPIGMTQVSTAAGVVVQNEYILDLYLPNKVCVPQIRVTEGKLSGGIDILVGMDIIGLGDFSVTNVASKTILSFRIPSLRTIDYVEDNALSKLPRPERRRLEKERGKI